MLLHSNLNSLQLTACRAHPPYLCTLMHLWPDRPVCYSQ
jgi:hypothetical protein